MISYDFFMFSSSKLVRYPFFDKRMAGEVSGDSLGDEFKGYVFRIGGGNDKQGFPMKQGRLAFGKREQADVKKLKLMIL